MIAALLASLGASVSKMWAKFAVVGSLLAAGGLFLFHIYNKGQAAQREKDSAATSKAAAAAAQKAATVQQAAQQAAAAVPQSKIPDTEHRNDLDTTE